MIQDSESRGFRSGRSGRARGERIPGRCSEGRSGGGMTEKRWELDPATGSKVMLLTPLGLCRRACCAAADTLQEARRPNSRSVSKQLSA